VADGQTNTHTHTQPHDYGSYPRIAGTANVKWYKGLGGVDMPNLASPTDFSIGFYITAYA